MRIYPDFFALLLPYGWVLKLFSPANIAGALVPALDRQVRCRQHLPMFRIYPALTTKRFPDDHAQLSKSTIDTIDYLAIENHCGADLRSFTSAAHS